MSTSSTDSSTLDTALQEEIRRRIDDLLVRRRETKGIQSEIIADLLSQTHPKQGAAIADTARYQAWCCGRRAGKTQGVKKKALISLLKAGFHQYTFFIAPTLAIGKDLVWAPLMADVCDRYQLHRGKKQWQIKENEGSITTDKGARFRIVGLDKTPQVDKLRGYDTVLFITDETQNYEHLLPPLLAAVAPALTGRRGQWVSVGTPGPTMEGFWYDACHGKHGFTGLHHWDVRDNTYSPTPGEEIIAEELARNGWDESHPTAQRELFGIWCEDTNYLVCEFTAAKNLITALPNDYGPHWRHVIGIDYGYVDATAWAVLACDPYSQRTVVVHSREYVPTDGPPDEKARDMVAEITHELCAQYGTVEVVCDPGGGGKPFFEAYNARFGQRLGAYIYGADKVNKLGTISLLNTELRTGRMTFVESETQTMIRQLRTLRWKDEKRCDILEGKLYPDHSFDALRYALIAAAPWVAQAKPEELTDEQKAFAERAKRVKAQQARRWYDR